MNAGTAAQTLIDMIVDEASGYDDVGRTIIAKRIMGVLSGWLPEREKTKCDPVGCVPMTEREASEFERQTVQFGKYVGQQYWDVPTDYLRWLADASRDTWRALHRYLNSPAVRRQDDD